MMARHRLFGLTGGIGSGKSTVAGMLREWNAHILDADRIARSLSDAGGAAVAPIAATFGHQFIQANGALDRDLMRRHVFSDATARRILEGILHPLVGSAIQQAIDKAPCGTVILDIPLLAESGRWRWRLEGVVVVDCSTDTQRERVAHRNGWPMATINAVIQSQASRRDRLKVADWIICNENLDIQELRAEVETMCYSLGL